MALGMQGKAHLAAHGPTLAPAPHGKRRLAQQGRKQSQPAPPGRRRCPLQIPPLRRTRTTHFLRPRPPRTHMRTGTGCRPTTLAALGSRGSSSACPPIARRGARQTQTKATSGFCGPLCGQRQMRSSQASRHLLRERQSRTQATGDQGRQRCTVGRDLTCGQRRTGSKRWRGRCGRSLHGQRRWKSDVVPCDAVPQCAIHTLCQPDPKKRRMSFVPLAASSSFLLVPLFLRGEARLDDCAAL